MMWRRNIHSLLTLAAEPSEPDEGAAVRPRGWPVSQGGGGVSRSAPKWKSTTESHTIYTFRKEKAAGMVPAFTLLQKNSQVHFAGASNGTSRSHQDQSKISKRCPMHKLTNTLWASALKLHCLSGERAEFFLCLFSACVTAKVQTMCGSWFLFFLFFQLTATRSSVGVTANGLGVITMSAQRADSNKLTKRNKNKVTDFSHIVEVSPNSLIKHWVQEMKACKREEACSLTTKANHKKHWKRE